MTDIVAPEPPHHHRKKTWVTDVNVYSKKKNGDDLNEFFNDDNDPLDEFGKYYCATFLFIGFPMRHFDLCCVYFLRGKKSTCEIKNPPFLFSTNRRSMTSIRRKFCFLFIKQIRFMTSLLLLMVSNSKYFYEMICFFC